MAASHTDVMDALHDVPPREFVTARNRLVARLRSIGRDDAANAVKKLPKPSATVWAINRVARRDRKLVARLLTGFERLRSAQMRRRGRDIRAAEAIFRSAVDTATDRAIAAMTSAGLGVTLETRRRLGATLRGAAAF